MRMGAPLFGLTLDPYLPLCKNIPNQCDMILTIWQVAALPKII